MYHWRYQSNCRIVFIIIVIVNGCFQNDIHVTSVGRVRKSFRESAVPRRVCQRRISFELEAQRVPGPSMVPKPQGKVAKERAAQENCLSYQFR